MEEKVILVGEAAKILGMTPTSLMAWMRARNPPSFGMYIKRDGCKQGRYYFFPSRLRAYVEATDMYVPDIYLSRAQLLAKAEQEKGVA